MLTEAAAPWTRRWEQTERECGDDEEILGVRNMITVKIEILIVGWGDFDTAAKFWLGI